MVRVLYLIENGSYRFDHRARREVCVLRDAGSLKETMVTDGDVYQTADSDGLSGLAEQVNRLAADAILLNKLCKAGLKRVKDVLSWPHQAPNLLQIYEELFPGQIEWGTYSASA